MLIKKIPVITESPEELRIESILEGRILHIDIGIRRERTRFCAAVCIYMEAPLHVKQVL